MADFGVLGPLTVTVDDRPVTVGGPRQRRLLAALLMNPGRVVSLDRLVDAVFDGRPSEQAEATVRSYATRLRRSLGLGPDVVRREGVGYRLDVAREDVDAHRFEHRVTLARRQADYGDTAGAVGVLRGALEMWRGEAYEDFGDEVWVQPEAHRLEEERREAQELLVDLEMQMGRSGTVIGTLHGLLVDEPFREGLVHRLMVAQYRDGRPVDALTTYADYRQRATDELGIDPGPELVELERRILARDPMLTAPAERSLRGYRLGERLGTGRLGTVFAATLPGVARDYAVRVYDPAFADDPAVVRSFESDVRAVASIDHPALLPLHDAWREPGAAAVVMRRMTGGTVQDLLDARALEPERARHVLVRVAGALLALSRRGRVHGRVRPSSVLLDSTGEAYLAEPALGLPAPEGTSDAADLLALARACLTRGGLAGPAPEPWLAELGSTPGLDVPSAVSKLLDGLQAAPPRPENPYVGLRAFDRGDADRFFGRDDLVREVTRRLTDASSDAPRFVLLVGGSGSGKSSVVRAGVLPALDRSGWSSTVMVPGSDPFGNLDQALARVRTTSEQVGPARGPAGVLESAARAAGTPLLLVVDQFEELFTLTPQPERDRFLDAIATAVTTPDGHLHAVATLRADYFDRPLDHPRFAPVAGRCSLPVPAMTPTELERTITGPAAGRLAIDDGLVADLVASTVTEPAALPALQFTLHELAERGGAVLGRSALEDLGGVDGAIAQRAEEVYSAHTADEQQLLRRVLTRLVVIDTDGDVSRRRVSRAELATLADDPAAVDGVVESWVAARLLVGNRRADTREPTVELAHEAILDRWPRLRAWIDEDRERLLALARLEDSARAWQELDRDPAALLRGARLEQAEDLLAESGLASRLATEFVDHSAARRAEEHQTARDEAARRERTSRRLRRQRWLLAAALALTLVVGGIAVDQRNTATRVAAEAAERARAATAGLAAASTEAAGSDWSLGLLLAAQAHRLGASASTYQALLSAVVAPRPVPTTLYIGERRYRAVEVDPVTGTIAAQSAGGVVELIDPDSGARVGGLRALGTGGMDIHDSHVVVSNRGNDRGSLRQFVRGESTQAVALSPGTFPTDVEFSPSGDRIAVSDTSGTVTVFDPTTWAVTDRLTGERLVAVEQVAWSETGDTIYALDSRAEFMVWEMTQPGRGAPTGRPPSRATSLNDGDGAWVTDEPLRAETGFGFTEMEPVPGSPLLVVGELDGPPWVIDVTDEQAYTVWPLGLDAVPRPSQVAVGADAGVTVRADGTSWALSSGYLAGPSPLEEHQKPPEHDIVTAWDAVDVAVAPDGTVVTVGSDGNVTRWDVPAQVPGTIPRTVLEESSRAVFSPDGSVLVHWGSSGSATLADGTTYAPIGRLELPTAGDTQVLGVAFQPERGRVLVASCRERPSDAYTSCVGELAGYDSTGALAVGPVSVGDQRPGPGSPLAVVSDPGTVATSDAAGTVTLRDPGSLEPMDSLDVLASRLLAPQQVALHAAPDKPLLLADPGTDSGLVAWDLSSDPPAVVFEVDDTRQAVFAPDGALVLPQSSWASPETLLQVVDTESFSLIEEFPTAADLSVARMSATDAGDLMVSADGQGQVWLWDAVDHRPLTAVRAAGASLRPDGDVLLLWQDGRAVELPLDEGHLLDAACSAAGRNLTEQEWTRYLGPDEPYRQTCPETSSAVSR